MTSSHRPRRVLLEKAVSLWETVHKGRYTVKRGPVNWSTWPFKDHPHGVSIIQDQGNLFPSNTHNGMRVSQISFEVFGQMPDASVALGTDEALAEEFLDDTEEVLYDLAQAVDASSGEPVIFNLQLPSATFTEHYDAHVGVQGFVITFAVTY